VVIRGCFDTTLIPLIAGVGIGLGDGRERLCAIGKGHLQDDAVGSYLRASPDWGISMT
jgi:hypothetical protein